MDPLRLAIALVPLSAYLLLVGLINLRRRPVLVAGANDLAVLGTALSGLVFVGPIELFRPEHATVQLGAYVWGLLLGLYWLAISLASMVMRPSLVVYNISLEELRPALADAVAQVDPSGRWAGDNLVLPRLGVQLHLDSFASMRNASLVSSGGQQDLIGWYRLRRALGRSLAAIRVAPNPRGVGMVVAALLLMLMSVVQLTAAPAAVARAWHELLNF